MCALVAAALRGAVAAAQWAGNPALRTPSLDAAYYLDWARALSAGDVLSAGPAGSAGPYLLNPLYAWLIAPIVAAFEPAQPWILAAQALLGGATAWLAANAAQRFVAARGDPHPAPEVAAWVAGAAVAFSAALVHLSTHISVATLAAFLVAGAVHSAAPATALTVSARVPRGHGPVAAGFWLGVGALARPVTLLALPFFAALHWVRRGAARRANVRAAATVVLVFAAFASISFVRNLAVSGEPVVFTAANGLNLHLGQNPLARRTRAMMSDDFRFGPVEMHTDAKYRVALDLGREPSRSEVSAWYRRAAWDDVNAHPGAALRFFGAKLIWFLSPAEPPSSADLVVDRERVPLLYIAFVPTWLLAALWLALWRRRDQRLLLGVTALVVAHAVAAALAFPLSHYRAPAIPALAVAVAVGGVRLLGATGRSRALALAALVLVAAVAWAVPEPGNPRAVERVNAAVDAIRAADGPGAAAAAADAVADEPKWVPALLAMSEAQILRADRAAALVWVERAVARQPWNVAARYLRATLLIDLGRRPDAIAEGESLVRDFPWSAAARGSRGALRAFTGDRDGARADLVWALQRGFTPGPGVLARAGLSRSD